MARQNPRQFVDFGKSWSLRMEVPYSGMVRQGRRAWCSGILALDRDGEVRAPGDLVAQAEIVAGYIDETLADGGLERAAVSRLVLYCAEPDAAKRHAVKVMFDEAFAHGPLIEFVSVPHFYYPGVRLEVDVFCAPAEPMLEEDLGDGAVLRLVREQGMALLNIAAPSGAVGRALGTAISHHGLSPDRLLSGWGVAPEPVLSSVPAQVAPRLPGFFSGALMPCFLGDDMVHLYLSFGTGPVELMERRESRVRLHLARSETLIYADARFLGQSGEQAGLSEQTEVVMDGLARILDEAGLSFADVVKSTTFYAGADNAEALNETLVVRNRYYTAPGPASTGVPIARMADHGSRVRVELVLHPA